MLRLPHCILLTRVTVGRNEEFLDYGISFAESLMKDAIPLRVVPAFVRP